MAIPLVNFPSIAGDGFRTLSRDNHLSFVARQNRFVAARPTKPLHGTAMVAAVIVQRRKQQSRQAEYIA